MKKIITSLLAIFLFTAFGACSSSAAFMDMEENEEMMSEVETGYVTVNGMRMFYREAGSDQGVPLILIHGWPLNSKLYKHNITALASENCHVYAIDLRGFGKSDMGTMGNPKEMRISQYANDVLAFMDEMGIEKAIIAGMSMGGPITFAMYQQAPDRFMGMLLIDTVAADAPPFEKHLWFGWAQFIDQKGVGVIPKFAMDEMLTVHARMNKPELVNTVEEIMKEASRKGAIAGAYALAYRPNFRPLLSSISVPTLILVGTQDTIYPPAFSKYMHKHIPNSTLALIENGSHASVVEEAEQYNKVINQWLEEQMMMEM